MLETGAAVQRASSRSDEAETLSRLALEKELTLKDREIAQLVADVHLAQAQLAEQRKVCGGVGSRGVVVICFSPFARHLFLSLFSDWKKCRPMRRLRAWKATSRLWCVLIRKVDAVDILRGIYILFFSSSSAGTSKQTGPRGGLRRTQKGAGSVSTY